MNVAHLGRRPTAYQRTALEWRAPRCTVEGCSRRVGLEIDQRRLGESKVTLLSLLDPLCDHHHDLKTRDGRKLVAGSGKRPIVPPDHPRHPDTRPPTVVQIT